ncbi:MAG: histone deacetylase family protein, partial [Myxococcales bacterium]|nr:histone deacetylase family protein [Myxococcales bacterium]
IDFHHGNGTQDLFWRDGKVFTASIHGDPAEFYPYFQGLESEQGAARGVGTNLNVALPRGTDGATWLGALDRVVLPRVRAFGPASLVVCAGLDGYKKDPVGGWALETADFAAAGERLGRLGLPTVVVQEGGYYTPHLGRNLTALLHGLRAGQAATR